ncbi:hypothetical protein GCM10007036_39550 [Alsobacter metallidurans]|uniref:Uncharacterized protein n=1 Tax=Alsobacter metallidurans TaxID=340221 RepID=A0A917I9F8_9HYPH|nr:hypothetical protein [Alsobacter metallidurans]GGH29552.1 hypothetical protein GCM10007036_39550 [Alsobacter metallidurans]
MAPSSPGDLDGKATQSRYPAPDDATLETLRRQQEAVLKTLFGEALNQRQIAEMQLSLSVQAANCEILHRFALNNADEPAFMFGATAGQLS